MNPCKCCDKSTDGVHNTAILHRNSMWCQDPKH